MENDKKIKFEVISRIDGYGTWTIVVYEGSWELFSNSARIYTIYVNSGKNGNKKISNKTFRLAVENTFIEENNYSD